MGSITTLISRRFLEFPISRNVGKRQLLIYSESQMVQDIQLQLDYVNPTEYVYFDTAKYIGKALTFEITPDMDLVIKQCDVPRVDYSSYRNFRPKIHFTPNFGWINDPNGLLEYCSPVTGITTYHMFFQHNPYSISWGNMHWGHATSTDLLNWTEQPIALFPDSEGAMFSGSAIIDTDNRSGLRTGDENLILLYYTSAGGISRMSEGKHFTQCLAYSNDGGVTFTKYEKNPILPHIVDENRDPKLVWCEELNRYLMALYLQDSTFAIFISDDLLHWDIFQKLTIPGEAECPDFYPLTVNGNPKERKWILCGASHIYLVCDFRNGHFEPIQEARPLHYRKHNYASQTFFGVPNGRRINIAWNLGLTFPSAPFNGQLSIPMEMTLNHSGAEYYLCAMPIAELEKLAFDSEHCSEIMLKPGDSYRIPLENSAYDISVDLREVTDSKVMFDIFGQKVIIEPSVNLIRVGNDTFPLSVHAVPAKLRIIVDTCSVELFSDNGEAVMTSPIICDYNLKRLLISSDCQVTLHDLTITSLKK